MAIAPRIQRAGPVRVTTATEAVREFRRETGWREQDGGVPLSFPVVWMKSPEIGEPIRAAAQEVGLPVHEAQRFDYVEPLRLDTAYDLMVELQRETVPSRLIAIADIYTTDGAIVGRVVSTLRLIDPAAIPVAKDRI
jgi:hypothetical protein